MTRVIALLGDPVAHSLSPRLHNRAMIEAGLNGVYVPLLIDEEGFSGLLKGLAWGGGAGNVTLPHKRLAFHLVDVRTLAAERTGAVNTFWREDGVLWGDNTDVEGFRVALRRLVSLSGQPVGSALILGAGGAARAALVGLADEGVRQVAIRNRSFDRAQKLVREFTDLFPVLNALDEGDTAGSWDLIVNATKLGLSPDDPPPLALDGLPTCTRILDLVYHPAETSWIRDARSLGFHAADGGLMLVAQGEAAYARWWGEAPPVGSFERTLNEIRHEARGPLG
jgi:shikimate dehydrogenase